MYYLLTHKKLVFAFLTFFILIPLSIYFFKNQNNPVPGTCLILEEKYCEIVEFIPDPKSEVDFFAAYKVPQGTVIFSPVKGELSNTPKFLFKNEDETYTTYPGSTVTSFIDRGTNRIDVRYSILFYKQEAANIDQIKIGDIIAITSERNIDRFGDFNLLVRISTSSAEGKTVPNTELLIKSLGSQRND